MIVIPMAGLSSRFTRAGYDKPKYMLEAKEKTLFEHSLNSFSRYFTTEKFLFIALDVLNTKDFIIKKCEYLGIENYQVVILDGPTQGQAETVAMGLSKCEFKDDCSITIFNIDTFRPDFEYPRSFDLNSVDGYLETFVGSGSNWSNVVPVDVGSDQVKLTAEKQELSEFCCTGLYYWRSAKDFMRIFSEMERLPVQELQGSEYYIAPMYNYLIASGSDIRFSVIKTDDVIFCGVPDEYTEFLSS